MAKTRILVDSSFLYAAYNQDDRLHKQAINSIRLDVDMVITQVVLVETVYLFKERSGVMSAVRFLDGIITSQIPLESIALQDMPRVREIMAIYASARFDFVDCCLMALSERLNITQVYTFDRRDFTIFRPKHCSYLELLPELEVGS